MFTVMQKGHAGSRYAQLVHALAQETPAEGATVEQGPTTFARAVRHEGKLTWRLTGAGEEEPGTYKLVRSGVALVASTEAS